MGPAKPLAATPVAAALPAPPVRAARAWADLAAKALTRSVSPVLVQIEAAMLARGVRVAWPENPGGRYELPAYWAVLGPEIRVRAKKPALEEACLTNLHVRRGSPGQGEAWQRSRLLTQNLAGQTAAPLARFASLEPEGDVAPVARRATSLRFAASPEPFDFAGRAFGGGGLGGGFGSLTVEPLAGRAAPEVAGGGQGPGPVPAPVTDAVWEPELISPASASAPVASPWADAPGEAAFPASGPLAGVAPEPVAARRTAAAIEPRAAADPVQAGHGLPSTVSVLSFADSWTPDYAPLLLEWPPWLQLPRVRRGMPRRPNLVRTWAGPARRPRFTAAEWKPRLNEGPVEALETEAVAGMAIQVGEPTASRPGFEEAFPESGWRLPEAGYDAALPAPELGPGGMAAPEIGALETKAAIRSVEPVVLALERAPALPESGGRPPRPGFARRRDAVRVHVGLLERGKERKAQPAGGQRLAGRWRRPAA